MPVRRWIQMLGLTILGLIAVCAPAFAQPIDPSDPSAQGDPLIVFTGKLTVAAGERVGDAVIFNGDAMIEGSAEDSVVAFNGDVTVSGSVGGDVVALNGRVTLEDGASVTGDVVSNQTASIAPGATVGGEVSQTAVNVDLGDITFVSRLAVWVATTVSSFLLGLFLVLFLPHGMDAAQRIATGKIGSAIAWGLLAFVAFPAAAFIALVTIVGIPLGAGVLLALGLMYWVGYTVAAFSLGRMIVKPPKHRMVAFLVGWGILRLGALIPVAGGLLWVAVAIWGLGALVVAARAAGRERDDTAPPSTALPVAVPPPPPMPAGP